MMDIVAVWLLGDYRLVMFFFQGFLSYLLRSQSYPQSLATEKETEITEPPYFVNESFPKRACNIT